MALIDLLTREHDVFRGLLDRIEKAFKYGENDAREEVRESFLLLIPALARHERLETAVFGPSADPKELGLQREVAAQHRTIRRLKARILRTLEDLERTPVEELRRLSIEACDALRLHFRTEERRLWPGCRLAVTGRAEQALCRHAAREVEELERSIEQGRAALSEYLGRRL